MTYNIIIKKFYVSLCFLITLAIPISWVESLKMQDFALFSLLDGHWSYWWDYFSWAGHLGGQHFSIITFAVERSAIDKCEDGRVWFG